MVLSRISDRMAEELEARQLNTEAKAFSLGKVFSTRDRRGHSTIQTLIRFFLFSRKAQTRKTDPHEGRVLCGAWLDLFGRCAG